LASFAFSEFNHSLFQFNILPSAHFLPFAAASSRHSVMFLFGGHSIPLSVKYLTTALPFSPTGQEEEGIATRTQNKYHVKLLNED
jgi:hypothetical protein